MINIFNDSYGNEKNIKRRGGVRMGEVLGY